MLLGLQIELKAQNAMIGQCLKEKPKGNRSLFWESPLGDTFDWPFPGYTSNMLSHSATPEVGVSYF